MDLSETIETLEPRRRMRGVLNPLPGVVYPPRDLLEKHLLSGALREETLIGAWREAFKTHGARTALISPDWSMSYAELDRLSDRAGLAFKKLGLDPLDRVAFQVGNSRNLILAVLGALKAGLIPLCTLHSHRKVEMEGLGGHAAIRAHFIDTSDARFDFIAFAETLRASVPTLEHVVVVNGPGSDQVQTLETLIDQAGGDEEAAAFVDATVAALDPHQVSFFQISGGSTGVPKIIPRIQCDYIANMRATIEATGINQDDCILTPGPLLHNAGLSCFWGPGLLAGARLGIADSIQESQLLQLFQHCEPTWLYMPKPLLPRLAAVLAKAPVAKAKVRGVVTSSGAAYVEKECGVPAYQFFGMTEGVISFTRPGESLERRYETVGWPVSPGDEVRLLKPGSEDEVEEGEAGELVVRGPYTLQGYYNAPAQNAANFTSDGWLRSGDLLRKAEVDGKPALIFEGRLKDLINRGGEKISCEEVERFARSYPSVLDVAVVPAPCPVYGERGFAFVILAHGHAPFGVKDLGEHLDAQGLAKYKWPEHVLFVEQFPTTGVSKLDKQSLRALAAATLTEGASQISEPKVENLKLSGVHHTARPTWKLRETVEFYRDIMGLKLLHAITAKGWGRDGHPDFLHFFFDSGRGSTIAFFYYLGTARPEYLEPRSDHNYRSTHTAWQVDTSEELVAWKERLEARGLKVSPLTNHEVIDSIYFHDPNGYNIEITVQKRAFLPIDGNDAELTIEAAINLEDEGYTLTSGATIETLWRRKAGLVQGLA